MAEPWKKLGIIAGGGSLPLKIAESCQQRGAPFHILALSGYADDILKSFKPSWCGLGEVGKAIRVLKDHGCDAVVLAGNVTRPNFATLRPDWRGAKLLPKILSAATQGDGAMLDVLVATFASEGFYVVGADDVATALTVPAGALGMLGPDMRDLSDMRKAAAVVAALGPFDVGQGAVVRQGFVIAIEAAEGTDLMLGRCAPLIARLQGEEGNRSERRGVLLKCPKPEQERRVDLPTIGVRTVELAAEAGLAGIAVEASGGLVLDSGAVARCADARGLFVYGYTSHDLREGA